MAVARAFPEFRSFIQAGFECSTHLNRHGRRLDLAISSGHEQWLAQDYELLRELGIRTVREGARWPLIEHAPGKFAFDSLVRLLRIAADGGMEVLLDLMHFGWPDHVDVMDASFAARMEQYAMAFVRCMQREGLTPPYIAPINEISFLSWGGGQEGVMSPHGVGRGAELKRNLIRAAVRASQVLRAELPQVRLFSPEPVIHVVPEGVTADAAQRAEGFRLAQFEAWDLLSGAREPELGGRPEYLDILGANFYDRNQWVHDHPLPALERDDPRYRPFHQVLAEVWTRYRRPLFVAETGAEDDLRADWFHYVCDEVHRAQAYGVPIAGICLYPIVNHPGWDDDRHCCNGLFDYCGPDGRRERYQPLADAIAQQQQRFATTNFLYSDDSTTTRTGLLFSPAMELRFPASSTPDKPVPKDTTDLVH